MNNPVKTSSKILESPHEIDPEKKTVSRIANGEKLAYKVKSWMDSNKDEFFYMYNFVCQLHNKHIKGRLRDRIISYCLERRKRKDVDDFKLTHATFAGITRYMVLYNPELLDDPIKFADSDIDAFGLFDVEYLHLNIPLKGVDH